MTTPRRKRYVIRYSPNGRYDNGPCWDIYDRQLCDIIEGGYTWEHALYAANFHNYQALGAGPWRA
jgi:hypothetical protein